MFSGLIFSVFIIVNFIGNMHFGHRAEFGYYMQEVNRRDSISLIVLGNVQDGGSPHIGCIRSCCKDLFEHHVAERKVVSLGIIDHTNNKTFLIEATPDLPEQLFILNKTAGLPEDRSPDGILITHAHIGHYSGLMYLGKEALGGNQIPVNVMPRMKAFLEENGPWSQLISEGNIELHELKHAQSLLLTANLNITPFIVPHRDEFSETVGFRIQGPEKSAVFIPDIDKWDKWDKDITEVVKDVDYAFLDGTFYDGEEIGYRDISEIPHPFIIESLDIFKKLSGEECSGIHFIHFNHTNPLLNTQSKQYQLVTGLGFRVARYGETVNL